MEQYDLGKGLSKTLADAIANSPNLDENGHLFSNINRLIYKSALGINSANMKSKGILEKYQLLIT